MLKSVNIKVTGTVQGVYYRQSAKEQADKMGLFGFVQNQPDGSVYMEVEGEANAVEALVKWCYQGPSRARVTKVLVEDAMPKGFSHFRINK